MHHDHAIGQPHDVDFVLADADGFDEDLVCCRRHRAAARLRRWRCARPPRNPRVAIERMNMPSIAGVRLHANAVAENRAAGVGARRDRPQ